MFTFFLRHSGLVSSGHWAVGSSSQSTKSGAGAENTAQLQQERRYSIVDLGVRVSTALQ